MTERVSTEEVRSIALSAVASVLLFMSGFLVLLTPLPLLYAFLKRGRRAGVAACSIAMVFVVALYLILLPWLNQHMTAGGTLFFALPGMGLMEHFPVGKVQYFGGAYFAFFLAVAFALGEGARKGWRLGRWVGIAMLTGMGSIILMAILAQLFSGTSLIAGARSYIEVAIAQLVKLNESAGITTAQTQYLAQHGSEIASLMMSLLPSVIFVFVLLSVVLNMLVGRRLARIPHAIARTRETITFRLQDNYIWLVIGCGSAFFLDQYVLKIGWIKMIALNGLIAMAALYFFQGFAVVSFFLEKVRSKFLRLIAYISIILFFQVMGLVIIGLGLADVWIHFRERSRQVVKH